MTAREIEDYMLTLGDNGQRRVLERFFKTAPGEYGHGDRFLGIRVPQTRQVVKAACRVTPLDEMEKLLHSPWHEVRLCGLLLMVAMFEDNAKKRLLNDTAAMRQRDRVLTTYLANATRANNWDLVDLSAPKLLGTWLLVPTALPDGTPGMNADYKRQVMDRLALSTCLWEQRIGMVCTWKTLQQGDPAYCLRYAEKHLHHPHDLMQKAVGWMLREMGKRVSIELLRQFLSLHAHEMPRTMLRYAIEKMSESERASWMEY